MSAKRYAETQSSFEEICLKFLQIEKHDALNIFLTNKLQSLKPQDKTQITMIALWVIELYLSQLADLRLDGEEKGHQYGELQKEFEKFLQNKKVAHCIQDNRSTIYDLMASHGDKHNLIKLTNLNKDYEQVIRQHIYKNSFHEALEVLKNQNRRDLFYQFAPILMQEIPRQTASALIVQGRNLLPVKLLPAFVNCDGNVHSTETIRYLEYCVNELNCTEKSIHNLLLSLYANTQPEKLMQYLAAQGQDISMVYYDVHFALRLCREKELLAACVQLSALLGLWESAVDLALKVSVDLAKQTANLPQNDNELRKKLWLKIGNPSGAFRFGIAPSFCFPAQHVISGKDDIKQAMEFLQQCDLIRIEDILSFFSDFVVIDHFKEAICNSLQECNQHIQDLKEEMEEATESAERVRNEIQTFRNRYAYIKTTDACSICGSTLIVRSFYLFPCGHKFHSDCLLVELTPNLGPAKRNKLHDLHRQLTLVSGQPDNVSTSSTSLSLRDQVKLDIDNIVASECLYCGEIMIRNIDESFIDEKDYERVTKEWE